MSLTEIFTIGFGLFLGYWVVSKLIAPKVNGGHKKSEHESTGQSSTDHQPDREPEWFNVLKVPHNATAEEIHVAYKSLIRQYHPDKVATLGEELKELAEEKSKSINAAYQAGLKVRGS